MCLIKNFNPLETNVNVCSRIFGTTDMFIILLPTIFNNIGILLLSYLANPIYMGYYYGISKIHRAFNTLYTPIFESFFPYIVKMYNKDKKIAYDKMKIYNLIIFSIGFIFFIIIWFLSENIIYLLLGNKFISAENYLKAFGFLLPLTVISYIWGNQWMVISGKEKKLAFLMRNMLSILLITLNMKKKSLNL